MEELVFHRIDWFRAVFRNCLISSSADSPKPTVLLTVSDSDTGVVIADCSTSVQAKSTPAGWRGELEQDFHWHRVNWELNEAELQCNTTADHQPIQSLLNSDELDAYLVQIKAADGPRCIKNLHADEESSLSACPPKLQKHSYFAEHLNCGCPIVKRGLPFAENTAFSSIRRKPASTTADPLSQPFGDDAESDEVASPAFPMFHFTQSVEHTTDKTTTSEAETPSTDATKPTPASAETAAPEQSQQISGEVKQTPPESLEEPKTTVESAEKTTILSSEATTPAAADPCDNFECNNGTCSAENGEAKCKCPEGFAGEHCEQDLCANLGCQNGGTCQVRNGRAVCNCPRGIAGEKCHQLNQPICTPHCENGGVCQASAIATEANVCKCPHGYTGSNCNLRDLCAKNSTCAHFGPDARCFKDAGDMFRFFEALSDGVYSCQCPTQRGFVECSQLRPALAKAAPTVQSSVPPRPPPTQALPEIEERVMSNEHSTEQIQFPMVTEAQSTVSAEKTSAEVKPLFGLTGLPGSQPTILPRPTQPKTPPPSSTPSSTMFTRLPDLSHLLSTPPSPTFPENESEEEGDNGFAPMTQELPEPTEITAQPDQPARPALTIHKLPATDSTKPKLLQTTTTIPEAAEETETEPISTENSQTISTESTQEVTQGPMGPEHSIVDETLGTETPQFWARNLRKNADLVGNSGNPDLLPVRTFTKPRLTAALMGA
uniref:Protein eyes shut n=1 Tax=Bursaphelenchus xylophilus TaxID=6326 RepID=A0A1I7RJB8_BURXY